MSRTSKKSYFKRRKTPMLNLGTVYVSDTLREITKKMKNFFDEYSVESSAVSTKAHRLLYHSGIAANCANLNRSVAYKNIN